MQILQRFIRRLRRSHKDAIVLGILILVEMFFFFVLGSLATSVFSEYFFTNLNPHYWLVQRDFHNGRIPVSNKGSTKLFHANTVV